MSVVRNNHLIVCHVLFSHDGVAIATTCVRHVWWTKWAGEHMLKQGEPFKVLTFNPKKASSTTSRYCSLFLIKPFLHVFKIRLIRLKLIKIFLDFSNHGSVSTSETKQMSLEKKFHGHTHQKLPLFGHNFIADFFQKGHMCLKGGPNSPCP